MALPDFPEYPHGKFVVAAAAKGTIMNSVQARCAKAAKNQTENKKKKKTKKKQLASAREAEGKGEEEEEEKEGDPPFGMNADHGYNTLYTLGTTIASCTWSILSTDVSVAVAVFVVLVTVCCDQFC